ncbi:bifunctional DNA primase/polymerase [Streptomyces luteolus]|uniref:Bifunctional DNA primase/polymerase n=1 Tax=Streptomyces luteolus TaxID=3043615 RepID=A0ABT6T6W1_9ACTN|nr:bifunctional DNA primase/polymerase [Streptomyces sp. B-S-A12]MDI3423626.1 bifunctional DNA primase/polymerase [Streptomyces sp. B-S-A12]
MTQSPDNPRASLLDAALSAAERGWHVFPLRPDTKRPALHGEATCPRTGPCVSGHAKWEQRATLDPDRIRAAWSTDAFNVGIATGPSGLLVVDLDVPKDKGTSDAPDGATTFKALCERVGQPVPDTYRVRTASGGEHLYFTAPTGIRLANTAGSLGALVDTRAWGGYVVGSGSITAQGAYEVIAPIPVTELPAWLLVTLRAPAPSRPAPSIAPARNASRCAQVALERESAGVAAAVEGQREATLFKSARAMGRFVAWGDIPRHEVEEAFQVAGESAGLKPHECRSTLRSALDWSIRTARPREAA